MPAPPAPASNRLHLETSPYLLQHADNPVHWRAWGAEALAEAQATNRPILLSIGYAACHWCHVMAHESFEDQETADLMNALTIPIKVDREERPDIDGLYMTALHALGEQGGWPLTMFLTPTGDPFWGGTYFPPEPRWGRPSFRQVLSGVAEAFHADSDSIRKNVDSLRRTLAAAAAEHPGAPIGPALLDRAAAALLRMNDPINGGLRGAPKFPNPPIFRLLWQHGIRTRNPAPIAATHLLLERMSQGGIYDHLGGGYARYSTDAEWLVPHFEKMLYDNAQLLELLSVAHADTPTRLYAARAEETVAWLTRDMTAAQANGRSAFAASEDADSEGVEGRFYVWTPAETQAVLGPDAKAFDAAYDVAASGNWEGHTILRRITPEGDQAAERALAASRDKLLAARAQRIRPGRDDKVLADWNGLTVAALCRAAAVFDRPDWLTLAGETFDFVIDQMAAPASSATPDGRIQHAWRLGRVTAAGLLDDQAAMARAALALFEATGQPHRLAQARGIVDAADRWFAQSGSSYFTTASDATDIPLGPAARPRSPADNATPNGNGMMAEVLARLHHLTGEPHWRTRAEAVLAAFSGLGDSLSAAPTLLAAADLLNSGASIVITGPATDPTRIALIRTALAAADPAICVLRAEPGQTIPPDHPAQGKPTQTTAAYLCRANICSLPVTDPSELARLTRPAAPAPAT